MEAKKKDKRDKISLSLTSIIEVVITFCIVHLNKVNSEKGLIYLSFNWIFIFLCPYVCDLFYNLLTVDSYATTTPRMTLTTKSTRRGIENFLRFGVIPAAGGTCILIYLILIIIFRPMPSADPFWFRRVTYIHTSMK